jgi:YidC/Oxa1 family membrane protein insertase
MAVLLLWQWIFPAEQPRTEPVSTASTRSAEELDASSVPEQVADRPLAAPTGSASPGPPEENAVEADLPRIEASEEETIVFETPRARVEFSNRGAQLTSFVLKDHPDSEGGQVDLVRRRAEGPYPFGLVDLTGASHPLNDVLFTVSRGPDGDRAVFEYSGSEGRALKSFALAEDGMVEVELDITGDGWSVLLGPGIRNPSLAEQKNRFSRRSVLYFDGEEVETLETAKVDERLVIPGQPIRWVGVQDTYFLSAFVPEMPLDVVAVQPVLEMPAAGGSRFRSLLRDEELSGEEEDWPRELSCAFRGRDQTVRGRAFFGAKSYDRLASLADPESGVLYGFEQAVEFGFFGLFARGLQIGLEWIHDNVVSNYGWAIILMTIVIRLILFPLTHKSFVSMQKMQELNPKIQAIRQKYRARLKDKQGRPNAEAQRKMNEEIMSLYKKEGVNPAGGCLPMLLQLPVLFAFYRLLSVAVEIRHAPWVGWITDLSAPDPYYVLPLVMGASQFVQQKLTPSTADPMQRRIFMLMPIFFTILFLGFPSGLVLYWLTNNVLGIVQQGVYRRLRHPAGGKN